MMVLFDKITEINIKQECLFLDELTVDVDDFGIQNTVICEYRCSKVPFYTPNELLGKMCIFAIIKHKEIIRANLRAFDVGKQ